MSSHIDTWNNKEQIDFTLPLDVFYDSGFFVQLKAENKIEIDGWPELFELKGNRGGDRVVVLSIYYAGEGSGSRWNDFKEILSQSTGKLVASCVWEGDAYISRLTIVDGNITEEKIEI
jgi:hypothetical protein